MNKAFVAALALTLGGVGLASCNSEAEAPAPANPEAPEGIEVTDARLNLPAVAGNPGAVYFTINNTGERNRMIRAVDVQGAGSAMMHQTAEVDGQSQMQEVMQINVPAGEELKFEPGGNHVMAMDLGEDLQAGGSTEVTITFVGGDKVSFPAELRGPGEE